MSFSSLIFTAGFLPIFIIIYTVIPGIERKNRALLLFSAVFYAFAGIPYLILMMVLTGIVYLIGKQISLSAVSSDDENKKNNQKLLIAGIAIIILILCFFKYFNAANSRLFLLKDEKQNLLQFALPLGISFYSFKLISYLSDVYTGKIQKAAYGDVLLYVLMFQEVAQGPISRFGDIESELKQRSQTWEDFTEGIFRFVLGLSKKSLLADHAGALAEQLVPLDFAAGGSSISGAAAYLAGLFYMLQLYLDFSAYSDMAIGLGQICGFHFPENFNYPYIAVSIRDFWRRWHISLSAFFRDYVYIPLGGSRVSFLRLMRNLLVVWLLTGIWHGSSWNYLLWGLYYFFFITLENMIRKKWKSPENNKALLMLSHVYTLIVVYFGWVLFRFSDFQSLKQILLVMLGFSKTGFWDSFSGLTLKNNIFFLIICIIAVTPAMKKLGAYMRSSMKRSQDIRLKKILLSEKEKDETEEDQKLSLLEKELEQDKIPVSEPVFTEENEHSQAYKKLQRKIKRRGRAARRAEAVYYLERTVTALVLLLLSVMAMVGNSYTPFLYNQF